MHVSEHTIRFWAKNGFFPFIKRSDKNVRLFDDEDLEWVKLVKCLRSAGVNHNEIKNYIKIKDAQLIVLSKLTPSTV